MVLVALAVVAVTWATFLELREPIPVCTQPDCDPFVLYTSDVEFTDDLGLSASALNTYFRALLITLNVVFLAIAVWIFRSRSHDPMAWLVSLTIVMLGLGVFSYVTTRLPAVNDVLAWAVSVFVSLAIVLFFLLIYLFPSGTFQPRWMRYSAIALAVLAVVVAISAAGLATAAMNAAYFAFMLALGALGLYSRVYRYRNVSGPVERQQTKWVAFGLAGPMVTISLWMTALTVFPADDPSTERIYFIIAANTIGLTSAILFPVAVAFAVLRYRLWDVDVLINRTLVYGPLTAILAGAYIASIVLFRLLSVALTGERSDVVIVLTTLVVAAMFAPVKTRLQAVVDRYFKEPPDAARALRALQTQARSVAEMLDASHLATRLLDEATAAFDAESGVVALRRNGRMQPVHSVGELHEPPLSVPIEHEGKELGSLSLGARRGGRAYGPEDRATLEASAAAVAYALSLAPRR